MNSKLEQIAKANNISPELALDWISARPRSNWLVIFDNADGGYEKIDKFWPPGDSGNILITTRNKELVRITLTKNSVEVHGMDEEEAISLLLKSATNKDKSEMTFTLAGRIVSELGYIPLAIDQAGSYMQACDCGLEDYLDLYHNECRELMMNSLFKGANNYGKSTYGTWEMSMKEIECRAARHSDPECLAAQSAVTIHKYFAFLHHDGISEDIFKNAAENYRKRNIEGEKNFGLPLAVESLDSISLFLNKAGQWSRFQFQAGIQVLLSFSLIKSSNKVYSIHPLVHTWSRDRISRPDVSSTYHLAAALLSCSIEPIEHVDNYVFCMQTIPHIKACYTHARQLQVEKMYLDDECERFAFAFYRAHDWGEAEKIYTHMTERRVAKLGTDHPYTLQTMHNLAATYFGQGRREQAERLALQVLDGRIKRLGTDHPDTLETMHNLAATYSVQGRWGEAEKLALQVLDRMRAKLGVDHPDIFSIMHSLAGTYWNQGKWGEVEKLTLQVLDGRKAKLGTDHPSTLQTMHSLAAAYAVQGRFGEAEKLSLQVLDRWKAKFGADHLDALVIMHDLATTYWHKGRLEEAEVLYQQVLDGRKAKLGADHPGTLKAMHGLALTYFCQGKWEEAEKFFLQVLNGRKAKLGIDHQDTIQAMHNLALMLEQQGRLEEAAVICQRSATSDDCLL